MGGSDQFKMFLVVDIDSGCPGPDDLPFIHEMFVVAANWNPARPTHDFETIVQDARMRLYVEDWGRLGDAGVIAEEDGVPVGAAWRRLYSAVEPSYGFLSSDIPEVSIGVRAAFRGRGIGGALLTALADDARQSGLNTLSLSVEPGNPALRPETRLEYGVGFSFLYPNLALSSSIFSSTTKDKIIYTMNAARMFIPKNVSDVNGLGLENDITLTPFPWISIANSFTFTENIVHSDMYPSWDGKDEPLLPRFVDNINIKLTYKNWYVGHLAHFSSQYFTDFDNTDSVRIKPRLSASTGCLLGGHFDFSYRIENYLNVQDYDFQRPLPGLSQYVVLKFNL